MIVLLRCLHRDAHPVKPRFKHGNGLLQGPTNVLAILRIRETQGSEIRQTIRAQGMAHLRKFGWHLLQSFLSGVEHGFQVARHSLRELM